MKPVVAWEFFSQFTFINVFNPLSQNKRALIIVTAFLLVGRSLSNNLKKLLLQTTNHKTLT